MLKGMNNIDYRHLFTFSNNRARSNGWKLELKRFNTSQCGNFFTYKIAPIWNRLPAEAVNSASVEQFKIKLDKVIDTLIWFFFFLGVSSDGLASLWGTSLIVTLFIWRLKEWKKSGCYSSESGDPSIQLIYPVSGGVHLHSKALGPFGWLEV